MPVVPIHKGSPRPQAAQAPDSQFALMAAAQMRAEGKFSPADPTAAKLASIQPQALPNG